MIGIDAGSIKVFQVGSHDINLPDPCVTERMIYSAMNHDGDDTITTFVVGEELIRSTSVIVTHVEDQATIYNGRLIDDWPDNECDDIWLS